jgi:hypothetical protein
MEDMKPRIYQIQFTHILSALKPRISAEDQLFKSQSLATRASHNVISNVDANFLASRLEQWLSKEKSFMFVIKAGPRAELRSKEFVINIVRFLQDSSCDIIWGFSNTGSIARPTSLSELLQGLIYQALSKQPGLLDHSLDELNITKFQQDHTETEWISLFRHLLARLKSTFIVVETEELFQANKESPQWAVRFLDLFQSLVSDSAASGNVLKILVVSYNTPTPILEMSNTSDRIVVSIAPPIPVPPRLRRPINPRKRKAEEWHHLRSKIWRDVGQSNPRNG